MMSWSLLFSAGVSAARIQRSPTHVINASNDHGVVQGYVPGRYYTLIDEEHAGRAPRFLVHMTSPESPVEMFELNRPFLPAGTEYRYVGDDDMMRGLRRCSNELAMQYNITHVFDAVMMLRPMAYRADIYRLCALWQYGGPRKGFLKHFC